MSCYKVPLYNRDGEVKDWAVIDEIDLEAVTARRWADSHGYARSTGRDSVAMHRLILGLPPGRVPEVDHLNGDKLDNRRINLRVATRQENNQNTDRFTGVDWNKGKWRARVRHNGVEHYLGHFEDRIVAEAVADAKRKEFVSDLFRPDRIDRADLPIASVRERLK